METEQTTDAKWMVWRELQRNGMVSYTADPDHNLSVGNNEVYLKFAEFCEFRGRVLDIGVGPQNRPSYMDSCPQGVVFVGIDPIAGNRHPFDFIQGVGETLPFRTGVFDQVIFVTSIDHFVYPMVVLRETKRVLKAGGDVCIWHGEKDLMPTDSQSPEWYRKLVVPVGAEDPFHFHRFSTREVEACLNECGMVVVNKEINENGPHRRNVFLKASR